MEMFLAGLLASVAVIAVVTVAAERSRRSNVRAASRDTGPGSDPVLTRAIDESLAEHARFTGYP